MKTRLAACIVFVPAAMLGAATYGVDSVLVRPVDADGRVVQGCSPNVTGRVGLGRADLDLPLGMAPDGALGFTVGRGWNRLRIECPGRAAASPLIAVLRGRDTEYEVTVPQTR